MANLFAIFVTGLTTGGLSCLAVQGGLLANTVARQLEEDVENELAEKSTTSLGDEFNAALIILQEKKLPHKQYNRQLAKLTYKYPLIAATETSKTQHHSAQPIVLFLAAKLLAYTAFGFLLGWVGSVLQLTPIMRGILQLAIGIFMVGTALRMFKVHPIFRYFVIEPPRFITRYIRRLSKNSKGDIATPLFLGALTVLIPCGITQGMMALAVGTGNPVIGAAIMFSFVLGTSPVFFVLSYLATRLGEVMHERFLKFAAVVVLILGLVSLEGGLNLVGSPISYASFKDYLAIRNTVTQAHTDASVPIQQSPVANGPMSVEPSLAGGNIVNITADGSGYAPHTTQAKAGQPITLIVKSQDLYTCAQGMVFPKLGIQKQLPPNGTTTIEIPAQPTGTLAYTCSMGMYRGEISIL
jgi:sulfite exporter TauE/SafE